MFDWSRRDDRHMPGEPVQGLLDWAMERFGGLRTLLGAVVGAAGAVLALVLG